MDMYFRLRFTFKLWRVYSDPGGLYRGPKSLLQNSEWNLKYHSQLFHTSHFSIGKPAKDLRAQASRIAISCSYVIFNARYEKEWYNIVGLPGSMPINTDQNSGIDTNVDQFRSMPINSFQCRSMPHQAKLIRYWSALIGIDRHWSALGIDRGSPDIEDTF